MLNVSGSHGLVPVVLAATIRAFDASTFTDEFAAGTPVTGKLASSLKLLYVLNEQLPLGSVASSLIACAGAANATAPTSPASRTAAAWRPNRICPRPPGMFADLLIREGYVSMRQTAP